MNRILGVDPGKLGGFAVLSTKGAFVSAIPMPLTRHGQVDLNKMCRFLSSVCSDIEMAAMEEISGFVTKKCGKSGLRELGRNLGHIEMGLVAFKIPYCKVQPQAWHKIIHYPQDKGLGPKERSRCALERKFSGVDLRASKLSKKNHEGMTEALLIAEWCRLKHISGVSNKLKPVSEVSPLNGPF